MKFFAAIVLIAAVASAEETKRPIPIIGQILEAIANLRPEPVGIGPAVVETEPISVGPAVVDTEPISVGPAIVGGEPISVGPAMIDFPLPDGGAVSAPVVAPSPVAIIEGPVPEVSASAPLVQIILNINQAAGSVPVNPVDIIHPEVKPDPVHVVDVAPEPVQIVEVAPEPVQVVETAPESPIIDGPILGPGHIVIDPVQVVEVAPVPIEPVQIGVPIIPEAAVVLPEQLN